MSWAAIVAEAQRKVDSSDDFLASYLRTAILHHNNFQSALVTVITAPFQTLIPKDSLVAVLLSVYNANNGIYEQGMPDLAALGLLDIKVCMRHVKHVKRFA
jgi:hypothetical protein